MIESELLNMIEHLPGVVYQYQRGPDGRAVFNFCSRSVDTLLFVTAEALAEDGSVAWTHVPKAFHAAIEQAYSESAATFERLTISFQVMAPGGEKVWVRNQAVPEAREAGIVVWNGHMVDVSARMAAEEERKRKDSLLRSLFNNLPDCIYYKDTNGRFIAANPACCAHHGKPLEELIGVTDQELYPGESGAEKYATEQRIMKERKIHHEREFQTNANGKDIYFDTIKCPLLSKSGRLFGIAGISRDITEQVANEQALEAARHEAEMTAGFIQALFDNLEDHFYYKDRDSRVLGGNKSWIKARGASCLEELLGKTDQDLYPGSLGQQLYADEQELIRSGEISRKREQHMREDGQRHYYESIKCPMRNERGEIIGLAGISRDATAQVENERVLIQARQAADEANKAKSMFLAMMSHEIRTPMNGIVGAASLLEGTALSALQKEFVRTINVSGESLLTLINDILDYSKIEAGKIVLEQIPFSPRECIEDCFDLFAQSAGKKNLELLHLVDADVPPMLIGDPTRLRQVIINLVGNAVKFTDAGEVSLRVEALPSHDQAGRRGIKITVKDTGCGIPEEVQGNLFQAFTQANASDTRKYGGTGLGLTISRRLVELMGGEISFESTYGEGSSFFFHISLPLAPGDEFRAKEQNAIHLLAGKRVLIIEKNEPSAAMLRDEVAQWNMVPSAFSNAAEALEHLRQGHRFDVGLIDYHLHETNGAALADAVRKQSAENHALPVVLLSSSFERCSPDPTAHAWLSKPVKHESLREQLLRLLSDPPAAPRTEEETLILPQKSYDLRILVAEDNLLNQRIIKLMLDRLGYKDAVVVPDGEDAVAAATDAAYDVILMDIQMPGMNGLEATRAIRDWSTDAQTPWILALSASVLEEERKLALEAGMNGFLAKPLAVDRLEEALARFR